MESNSRSAHRMLSGVEQNRLHVTDDGLSANCHLVGLMPFESIQLYEVSLAINLAVKHLNEGDGSLVKEVGGLRERCPIDFSASVIDSTYSQNEAFVAVDDLTRSDSNEAKTPCAFVGAQTSSLSKTTAIVTGLRSVPQLSHAATNTGLGDKGEYPLFGRTIPDDGFMAEAWIRFFHETMKIRHIYVIVENDPFPRSVLKSIRDAIRRLGWAPGQDQNDDVFYLEERLVESRTQMNEMQLKEELEGAVEDLKVSEYRFVIALTSGGLVNNPMMEIAYDHEVAGNGSHHWWFFETLADLNNKKLEKDSKLAKAFAGVGYIYQTTDRGGSTYERFEEQSLALKRSWYTEQKFHTNVNIQAQQQVESESFADVTGELFLNRDLPHIEYTEWFSEGFREGYIFDFPSFAYDATILLGLSACHEANVKTASESLFLDGISFFDRIRSTNFTGITGVVKLDQTGTRDGHTVKYSIDNLLPYDDPSDDSMVIFRPSTAYSHLPGQDGFGTWETVGPYVFSGNQTTLGSDPDLPPLEVSLITVDQGIQGVSFAMLVIIILATFGFSIWTCMHWNCRVVRASQPPFLLLLCFGIAVMALSIIPYSLEHIDIDHTDVTCYSQVYLLTIGFGLTFSALFAKTFRVNTILRSSMQFRRVQLSFRDFLYPVVVMLLINVVLLLLLTVFGSIEYEQVAMSQDKYGRDNEVLGRCVYNNDAIPFVITIVIVNISMVFLALLQAWRARHMSTEFAESKFIGHALFICFLIGIFAYPVRRITSDNPNATTFINTVIISVFSASTLCFIFIPKVIHQNSSMKKKTRKTNFNIHSSIATNGSVLERREQSIESSDEPESNGFGERILTTKPQELLVAENQTLEKELAAMSKRAGKLALRNNNLKRRVKQLTGENEADNDDDDSIDKPTDRKSVV